MLILIADAFDEALPKKLAKFGEVTSDAARLPEADIVLVRSKTKCTPDWIDQAKKLKLIIRGGVGMDNIDKPYALSKGVKAVNTAKASSIAVAELAFALMIAVPNQVIRADNSMKKGEFLKKEIKRTELFGKTLGLLGLGNIATEVAVRAKAFGMKVIAYRKSGQPSDAAEVVKNVDELYARADYISMHLPLTDETKEMINAAALAKMKKGVIIVNTGRGKTVNEADLKAALESGQVAAYATDVYYSDPPAPDCPLLSAPRTLMTPHIGSQTKENMDRIGDVAVEIIADFVKSAN